jgi:hypothetical protein
MLRRWIGRREGLGHDLHRMNSQRGRSRQRGEGVGKGEEGDAGGYKLHDPVTSLVRMME